MYVCTYDSCSVNLEKCVEFSCVVCAKCVVCVRACVYVRAIMLVLLFQFMFLLVPVHVDMWL